MEEMERQARFAPQLPTATTESSPTHELPFSVLVLSDLTGDARRRPLSEREAVFVDMDNFSDVMRHFQPELRVTIDVGGVSQDFELFFRSMEDFGTTNILYANTSTKKLLGIRDSLYQAIGAFRRSASPSVRASHEVLSVLQELISDADALPSKTCDFNTCIRQAIDRVQILEKGDFDKSLAVALVEQIDHWLSAEVTAVTNDVRFKELEQRWMSIRDLLRKQGSERLSRIRLLNITQTELAEDLAKGQEESVLWKHCLEEFSPGGEPFGLMLGDFEFNVQCPAHIELLGRIAGLTSHVFSVFVAGVCPNGLGFDDFSELPLPRDLRNIFQTVNYGHWRSLRETFQGRHLGLCLPRLRMRYRPLWLNTRAGTFDYSISNTSSSDALLGNAAFGFAAAVLKSHIACGWPVNCVGRSRGKFNVADFPLYGSNDGSNESTETSISSSRAEEIRDCGFIPILHDLRDSSPFIWDSTSICKPKHEFIGDEKSQRLAVTLSTLITSCRLAITAQRLLIDLVGLHLDECTRQLRAWLRNYIATDKEAVSLSQPLLSGCVDAEPIVGQRASVRLKIVLAFGCSEPVEYEFLLHHPEAIR